MLPARGDRANPVTGYRILLRLPNLRLPQQTVCFCGRPPFARTAAAPREHDSSKHARGGGGSKEACV